MFVKCTGDIIINKFMNLPHAHKATAFHFLILKIGSDADVSIPSIQTNGILFILNINHIL